MSKQQREFDLESTRAEQQLSIREGRRLRYFVQTFGCQQNENDSEKIAGILECLGFLPALSYTEADLILINSCSIRENADDRLFGHLGMLKQAYEDSGRQLLIGVCGCMVTRPQLVTKIKESYPQVRLLMTPQEIHELPKKLIEVYRGEGTALETSMDEVIVEGIPQERERRFRALLSIMYGCNHFCSYCVVPFARGRQRSRRAHDILAEASELAASGFTELMLLGQNVNAWGLDHGAADLRFARGRNRSDLIRAHEESAEPKTFPELLAALAAIPGIRCIRYMSPHPRDFTPQMIDALALFPEIESRLHLPLQSGSDRILRAMRRGYKLHEYRALVQAAREARPDLALTTDIIVAFPGESESDFEATLSAVEEFAFQSAYTFIFSPRPGTPAAHLPEIPAPIASARFQKLLALQNRLTAESYSARVGKTVEVLVEGASRQNPSIFTARDHAFYLYNLELCENALQEGDRLDVLVTEARAFSALARPLERVRVGEC